MNSPAKMLSHRYRPLTASTDGNAGRRGLPIPTSNKSPVQVSTTATSKLSPSLPILCRRRTRIPHLSPYTRNQQFADLYGSFSVKWLFGLLPVFCSERKGRFSSRRLRLGSRSARKGSRDRNASVA